MTSPTRTSAISGINQTEQLAGKAAQTQRAIERLDVVDKPREPWELRLEVPHRRRRSGDVVARLTGVVVDRGAFRLGPIDLMIEYGDRVALVGRERVGQVDVDRRDARASSRRRRAPPSWAVAS